MRERARERERESVCVCVCERERESERERERERVGVCVSERERERERERDRERDAHGLLIQDARGSVEPAAGAGGRVGVRVGPTVTGEEPGVSVLGTEAAHTKQISRPRHPRPLVCQCSVS